jgi:hypothetical protein
MVNEKGEYVLTDMAGLAIIVDKETYEMVMNLTKGVKQENENQSRNEQSPSSTTQSKE